jgi:hypothetical protein
VTSEKPLPLWTVSIQTKGGGRRRKKKVFLKLET